MSRKKAAEHLAALKKGRQLVIIEKLREKLHENTLEAVAASIDSANGFGRGKLPTRYAGKKEIKHLIPVRKLSEIRGSSYLDSKMQKQWTNELDVSFNLSELLYLDTYFHERNILDLSRKPFILRPVNLIDCLTEKGDVTFLLSSQALGSKKKDRGIKYISHYDAECFSHLSREENIAAQGNRFSYYDGGAEALLDDMARKDCAYVACGAPHVSAVTRILFENFFNRERHSAMKGSFPFAFYYQGLFSRPPKSTKLYFDAEDVRVFLAARSFNRQKAARLQALVYEDDSGSASVQYPKDSRVLFIDKEMFIGKRGKVGYGLVCATRTESNIPVVAMVGDFGTTTAELGRALAERGIEKALPERRPGEPQTMMITVFRVTERAKSALDTKRVYGPRMYTLDEDGWFPDEE